MKVVHVGEQKEQRPKEIEEEELKGSLKELRDTCGEIKFARVLNDGNLLIGCSDENQMEVAKHLTIIGDKKIHEGCACWGAEGAETQRDRGGGVEGKLGCPWHRSRCKEIDKGHGKGNKFCHKRDTDRQVVKTGPMTTGIMGFA